ncbi:hypothetical protein RUM43_005473 [Polyplax serrata]|uniref:VWFC domain-containing protein n=1 Tax=Polyplax serrata TaxID=468196 RepID=A0AAN8S4S8_POLSC
MTCWFIKLLVTVALAEQTGSLPLACVYNGTSYTEGDTVKTSEPCLSCTCRRGSLNCNLRVCADVPQVTSPGCLVVYKTNDCCPQLLCEENYKVRDVEVRTAFKTDQKVGKNDCIKNGTLYAEGSAVGSSSACEYCYCIRREIKCIKPKCYMPLEGCRPIYQESSCCPTHYDCSNVTKNAVNVTTTTALMVTTNNDVELRTAVTESITNTEESQTSYEMSTVPVGSTEQNMTDEGFSTTVESTTFDVNSPDTSTQVEGDSFTTPEQTEGSDNDTTTTVVIEITTTTSINENSVQSTVQPIDSDANETTTTIPAEQIENKSSNLGINSAEGNVTDVADDYENYDYNEPKLPPSLPNLVILPFVAADAVVKDQTKTRVYEYDISKNYFNEFFTPPVKTEGGFVPRDPPNLIKQIDEYGRNKDNYPLTQSSDGDNVGLPFISIQNLSNSSSTDSFERRMSATNDSIHTNEPYSLIKPKLASDLAISTSLTPPRLTHFNAKPVTVTYKDAVLDYYPELPVAPEVDYSLTTRSYEKKTAPNRAEIKFSGMSPVPSTTVKSLPILAVSDRPNENVFTKAVKSIPHIAIVDKTSILTNIFKSLLEESRKQSTTVPTSVKKISSNTLPLTPQSFAVTRPVTSTIAPVVPHPEPASPLVATRRQDDSGDHHFVGKEEPGFGKFNKNAEVTYKRKNFGSLLKLAGCNIYGRMYRVGKIIAELSGPCVECICTDVGVQCSSPNC